MNGDLEAFRRNYTIALMRFLPDGREEVREAGYQLGRAAIEDGVGLLEVCRVHHECLLDLLSDVPPDEILPTVRSASDFLLEVLSTYDMTQRGSLE